MQPQSLPARTDSVSLLGGAATGRQSAQMVRTRLMQSAVSYSPDTQAEKQHIYMCNEGC